MTLTVGRKTFNKFRTSDKKWNPVGFKGKFLDFLQMLFPFLRDDGYYSNRIVKNNDKLKLNILIETNWLGVTSYRGNERSSLAFHEQAIKYYEYKNMVIQKRSQYVIIFLTIARLIMTGLQIYLQFFKK